MLTSGDAMAYELGIIPSLALFVNIMHELSSSVFGKLTFYYAIATMTAVYIDNFSVGFRHEINVQFHRILANVFYFILSVFCFSVTAYILANKMQRRVSPSMILIIHTLLSDIIRQGQFFYMVFFFLLHNIVISFIRIVTNAIVLLYIYLAEKNGWGYEVTNLWS